MTNQLEKRMKDLGTAIIIQACVDYVKPKITYNTKWNPSKYTEKYRAHDAKDAFRFLTGERLKTYCKYFGIGYLSPKIDKQKIKRELDKASLQRLGFVRKPTNEYTENYA